MREEKIAAALWLPCQSKCRTATKALLFAATRIPKDLGRESLQECSGLPCVREQSSFAASLLQESHAIPTVLHGHLRQQKSAPTAQRNHQPVPANLDCSGSIGRRGDRMLSET